MLKRGVVAAERGQNSLQNQFYFSLVVFIIIFCQSVFAFMHFQSCNGTENSQFHSFLAINFVLNFQLLLVFRMRGKTINLFSLEFSFLW